MITMTTLNSSPQSCLIENPSSILPAGIYLTVQQTSDEYRIPKWKLYKSIKRGILREYSFLNSRKYLCRLDIDRLFQVAK